MLKLIIPLLLFFSLVSADALDTKLAQMLGKSEYFKNKKLLTYLFKDRYTFIQHGQVNFPKVVSVLRQNGMMKSRYSYVKELQLSFSTQGHPQKLTKAVLDSLHEMGYNAIFTKGAKKVNGNFKLLLALKVKRVINFATLAKELQRKGVKVLNIIHQGKSAWRVGVDVNDAQLAERLESGTKKSLKKSASAYWLDVTLLSRVAIRSMRGDRWHPYVSFLDSSLNVIKSVKDGKVRRDLTVDIPAGAKYIKLSDIFTHNNIKRGLEIEGI
jgi:hypothetical protein